MEFWASIINDIVSIASDILDDWVTPGLNFTGQGQAVVNEIASTLKELASMIAEAFDNLLS